MPAKKVTEGFTEQEKAAMKEAVRERRARSRSGKVDGEAEVRAKIAAMQPSDRALAERFHAIIKANAPALSPKTWYGMPAYANAEGHVVCFFQDARKFGTRYATLGFSDEANLDDGNFWATGFALKGLTPADEARVVALVKRAVS